ncbi:hypothetical protein [Parafrankia elaeagni]|uniref:hypothetical protein n=1 Tax=Parafrankia elaeagni TaxID=222534 RepID=UPI0018A8243E|nr:hypothetical protein [Parafrankia elaeagni]
MIVGMNEPRPRYTRVMANFTSKVQELLHSPKAREMVDKAKMAANKPENREKFRHLSSKFTSRGRGPGGGHTPHASTTSSTSSTSGVGGAPGSPTSGSFGGDSRSDAERERSDYGPF